MTFATAMPILFTSFVYHTNVYRSVIHGIKRKPHLSVVWNWYHWVTIAILRQPRPTDSADINMWLQLSDTSSIPPMHGGFLLLCGTWYHHLRCLQCVLSRNLRIFKVATWHYRCRHNLKNNCIWDNLQCCLLVPRSPNKPVMLTFDLQSRKVLFIEIVFWHV